MNPIERVAGRLLLSQAKHPSLRGHAKMALRVSRLLPFYEYDEDAFFACDGAPESVARERRDGFRRLASTLSSRSPKTLAMSEELEESLSDVAFVNAYRVPF